jgi:hypothetical protein
LENPAQRLQDRLFWFNCTEGAARQDQLAPTNALEAHDAALRKLFAAVAAGIGDGAVTLWADALADVPNVAEGWGAAVGSDPAIRLLLNSLRTLGTSAAWRGRCVTAGVEHFELTCE